MTTAQGGDDSGLTESLKPMKTLNVCHLGKYYPPASGGIETHVRTLALAQAALGANVRVFCVNHQAGPTVVEDDGPVEVTRFGRLFSALKLDVCPELIKSIRNVEADILHLQVPNPTMILAVLAARPRQPLVVTYQSDVVVQKLRAASMPPVGSPRPDRPMRRPPSVGKSTPRREPVPMRRRLHRRATFVSRVVRC